MKDSSIKLLEQFRTEKANRPAVKRLCIIQESGIQLFSGRYESHIHCFIPFDDLEYGKQYCAELNEKTDLPFYLSEVEVKLVGEMTEYTVDMLAKEGIEPLK